MIVLVLESESVELFDTGAEPEIKQRNVNLCKLEKNSSKRNTEIQPLKN